MSGVNNTSGVSNNVWCTLVMLNDTYAVGAAVVARSLRSVNTKYPIWCMYSNGVSDDCVEFLKTQFDNVVKVPLISYPTTRMKSQKQNDIYGSWIAHSFTKCNVFNPQLFPVDKVMLLDADMLFVENCDELFNMPTPAMTFSSPWAQPYFKHKRGAYNPYGEMKHGQEVPRNLITRAFNGGILGLACMVLVKPDAKSMRDCIDILRRDKTYGDSDCISGFDEQLFVETMLKSETPIYHIHQQYNWIVGKYNWLLNGEKPKTMQWYNDKPWVGINDKSDRNKVENSEWDDVRVWWKVADNIMELHPESTRWFYPGGK